MMPQDNLIKGKKVEKKMNKNIHRKAYLQIK